MAGNVIRLKPIRPCPICGRPSSQQHHPFCSGRCADIDLNRWLSGSYVIPADAGEAADEVPPDDGSTDGDGD
ncbi:MAG: DNA gyrase inhibitor YacG [Devosia sp.]|nr:DNA gyrase inhibitor YacG [Devosia sp.]